MSKHSTLIGGSSAARLIACPGSWALSEQMPERPPSEFAMEGSMLHEAIALIIDESASVEELVNKFKYHNLTLTDALVDEMIQPALDQFDEICADLKIEEFEVESKVTFGERLPGCWGTADVVGTGQGFTLVLDWKFGRGVEVDAEGNSQLMFYAAAARLTPETADLFDPTKPIVLAIVQPAMGLPSIWSTTHEGLDAFVWELDTALKEMQGEHPSYASGSHCRWCPAKPICPVLSEQAITTVDLDINELTGKDLPAWLERAELLEQWIAAVQQLAHQTLEDGGQVPGWKLVNKRATRRFTNETEALELMQSMRIPLKKIYPKKMLTVAAAEKLLEKRHPKQWARLQKVIEKKSSGTTLAREDDSRPAVMGGGAAIARLANALKVTAS